MKTKISKHDARARVNAMSEMFQFRHTGSTIRNQTSSTSQTSKGNPGGWTFGWTLQKALQK